MMIRERIISWKGHHNLINSTLGFSHPTIWKFIDGLKKDRLLSRARANPQKEKICRLGCTFENYYK